MCGICGCDHDDAQIGTPGHEAHAHGAAGRGGAHSHGAAAEHLVRIEQGILAKNDAYAAANRGRLARSGVLALNLLSSPGAGKTSLLVATIGRLKGRAPLAVIEGDQQTENDAARIRAAGAPAVQINTGRGCHLDAHMVGHAMDELPLRPGGVLFIENVGNLVCPAAFDLGEAHKVVILSVTEGEDKPIKYPDMFAAARLLVIGKIDLLPYVRFDADRAVEHARRVNPAIEAMRLSAETGDGLDAWIDWILAQRAAVQDGHRAGLEREAADMRDRPAGVALPAAATV